MDHSDAIEKAVREKAEKLDQFSEIMSCRAVVRMINKHQHKGTLYQLSIDIKVPGAEIVVSRNRGIDHSHEDVYVAIRDSFDAARRQLQDHHRISHQKVKVHEVPPHGRVSELYPDQSYGRIETPDGRSIYFHQNSVLKDEFVQLEVGSEVRFSEENGDEGPQASTVQKVGKHHVVG
jgi:cold shock CspA family protein/ribosome-associated translation inhibitor RaiA